MEKNKKKTLTISSKIKKIDQVQFLQVEKNLFHFKKKKKIQEIITFQKKIILH